MISESVSLVRNYLFRKENDATQKWRNVLIRIQFSSSKDCSDSNTKFPVRIEISWCLRRWVRRYLKIKFVNYGRVIKSLWCWCNLNVLFVVWYVFISMIKCIAGTLFIFCAICKPSCRPIQMPCGCPSADLRTLSFRS